MPDDSDVYLRIAQIYRELHQLDKAEENLVKARQYAPGNLEVMYNEGMLYESQGRYEDAIRVLSDAVSGIKGQSTRSEEHTSELQSHSDLVCRLLLEKKKIIQKKNEERVTA